MTRGSGVPLLLLLPLLGLPAGPAQAQAAAQGLRIVEGPPAPLGNGSARAWVALTASGAPGSIGVSMTDDALSGLPADEQNVALQLPEAARQAGYDHVWLNWNPHGHEPPGIYSVPHFDVHFYRISTAERERIDPSDPDYEAKLAKAPPAGMMPPGYVQTPGGVPRMGAHWVQADAPEFTGHHFEKTLVLGSDDGQFIFVEPMITRAFLLSRAEVTLPVPTPERSPVWWPQSYEISFHNGVHQVALSGLRPLP
jgi:hypothetical protein